MEKTKYARARAMMDFIGFAGWFYIVLGFIGLIMWVVGESAASNFWTLIYTIMCGVLALAFSQLVRAVLDIADNSREILLELRKRKSS